MSTSVVAHRHLRLLNDRARDAKASVIAPVSPLGTVAGVPDLTATRQQQIRLARLGRITENLAGASERSAPVLSLVRTRPDETPHLPHGAVTRRLDAAGRLKLQRDQGLRDLLGWEPGAVEVVFEGSWAVLRQPARLVGAKRQRWSHLAYLTRDKASTERLCVSPAHLERLYLGADRQVLVVPIPDVQALVLVAPGVVFAAPTRVLDLVDVANQEKAR